MSTDNERGPIGSAKVQSSLWGERAEDWAEVMEGPGGWGVPVYRHVAGLAGLGEGSRLLDVGCGAGRFCQLATEAGAAVAGIDATPELLEIARARVPDADLHEGDMEDLPWPDDSFEIVTGFNSFFIAADMTNALREASRVARPGGHVAMTVFGRPDHCDSTKVFGVLGDLMGAPAAETDASQDAEAPPPLHAEGTLETVARAVGLEPTEAGYFSFEEEYDDRDAVVRGMGAAPPFRRAASVAGEEVVRTALEGALSEFEERDGRIRLREEVRFLVASA